MKSIIVLFVLFVGFNSYSQLPSKVEKLAGEWRYKEGSGFEVWKQQDDMLHGYAYRINKVGDTSMVEDIVLKKINNSLVYALETYNRIGDSVVTANNSFVGERRKMSFINILSETPYSISYSFGFLSRNKLKIKIRYVMGQDPVVLKLVRIKD